MLPKAIRQFLFITEDISEYIISVVKAPLLLSPQYRLRFMIQERGRMFMFQARPRAVTNCCVKMIAITSARFTAMRVCLILGEQLGPADWRLRSSSK